MAPRTPTIRRIRRVATGILLTLLIVVAGLLVVVMLPPARTALLGIALERAAGILPGQLRVEEARWPGLSRITLEGVLWTDGADTLIAATRVEASVDVTELLKRDLHVRHVLVEHAHVNLPGLGAAFGGEPDSTGPAGDGDGPAFPRPGSLPGVPSVAADSVHVSGVRLILPDSTRTWIDAEASAVDLRADHPPAGRLGPVAVRSDAAWALDSLDVTWDLGAGRVEGSARGRLAEGLPVFLDATGDPLGNTRVVVALERNAAPPATPGVRLDLDFSDPDPGVIDLVAVARIPDVAELRRVRPFVGPLRSLPELEGFTLTLAGRATTRPDFTFSGTLATEPNAWQHGVHARFAYAAEGIEVDSLTVQLPQARLEADGEWTTDRVSARAILQVEGLDAAGPWLTEAPPIDSLRARLVGRVEGNPTSPRIDVDLSAQARAAGVAIDSLHLVATTAAWGAEPLSLDVRAVAAALGLAVSGELTAGTTWNASLSPILVSAVPRLPTQLLAERPARLAFDPSARSLSAEHLAVRGDAGRWDLDATADIGRRGTIRLVGDFPRPPRLLPRLVRFEETVWDSIRVRWPERCRLEVDAELDLSTSPPGVDGTARWRLPGPATWAPLLPAKADWDRFGPLGGTVQLSTSRVDTTTGYDVHLTFDATDWITGPGLRGRYAPGRIRVDTLGLVLDELTLGVSGTVRDTVLDVGTRLHLEDGPLLRGLLGTVAGDSLDADLELRGHVQGTFAQPRIDADLAARFSRGDIAVPELTARIRFVDRHTEAQLISRNMVAGDTVVDSLLVTARTHGKAPLPVDIRVQAAGPEGSIGHTGTLEHENAWTLRADSLAVEFLGMTLAAVQEFRVAAGDSATLLQVDGLRMEGSLGTLRADLALGRERTDLDVRGDLRFPDRPPALADIPAPLWPDSLRFTANATENGRYLEMDAVLAGVELAPGHPLRVALHGESQDTVTVITMNVLEEDRLRLEGEVRLPQTVRLSPLTVRPAPGPVSGDIRLTGLPLPLGPVESSADRWGRLDGNVRLRGRRSATGLDANLTLRFPGIPELDDYRVEVGARLLSGNASPSLVVPADGDTSILRHTDLQIDARQAAVYLEARRGDRTDPILHALISVPIRSDSLGFAIDSTRAYRTEIVGPAIPLEDVDAVLPPSVGLSGDLSLELLLEGRPGEAEVSGKVRSNKLNAERADGSRVSLSSELTLSGTTRRPRVNGNVRIDNGIILLPETPRGLLPVKGDARLWALERFQPDTTEAPPPRRTAPPVTPDLDVTIEVPSGLKIRDRRMDIDFRGTLQAAYKNDVPTLTGELTAYRGTFLFAGRQFTLQSGRVTFYGDDELNPTLDIVLRANVESYQISVQLTGTAREPRLELTSNPELSQGDIFSTLIFGKPANDLDTGQMGYLQDRAGLVAATYLAQELEGGVGKELGVDLISIGQRPDQDEGSTLVIGKYLSPRALLKYEQALETGAGFFVNLEYRLRTHITVETLYGSESQSAVELNYSRDY